MTRPAVTQPVPDNVARDLHDISLTLKMLLAAFLASQGTGNAMWGPNLRMLFCDDNGATVEYDKIAAGIDGSR